MTTRPILFSAPMIQAILAGRKTQTRRVYKARVPAPYEIIDELDDGAPWPFVMDEAGKYHPIHSPYGVVSDGLRVRETWRTTRGLDGMKPRDIAAAARAAGYRSPWAPIEYVADGHRDNWSASEPFHYKDEDNLPGKTRPAIFLPTWASRIHLQVTGVRVERLQDITEEDAKAEGVNPVMFQEHWSVLTKDGGGYDCFVEPEKDDDRIHSLVHCPERQLFDARHSYRRLWMEINGVESLDANPYVWVVSFKRAERPEAAQ